MAVKKQIVANNQVNDAGLIAEVEGLVQGHRDGHGFVQPDAGGGDIYLSPQEMRAVLHRDRVRVRVIRLDRKGRPEGRVVDILARRQGAIIGRLLSEGGGWVVAPEDRRYGQDILIPKNAVANAQAGQVVAVELTEPPSMFSQPVGRVTEVLGQIDDPGMEIEIAVRKYEVPHIFSPETVAQAAALPEKLRPTDRRQRIDLRDVPLVTIDGEDARDFDDAVYCEPYSSGRGKSAVKGWRLLVAIADVSHYVKPGEALDKDAFERATSVYFPRRVIPMLPEKLSNGLCSLNPEVERLCLVCDMLVSEDGEVSAYQFYPALMRSAARFTYTEVAAVLANTRGPEAAKRAELVAHLIHLHEVYRALFKTRQQRGAMDFETTETQIVCDENGRIEKIIPRTRNDAHKLIEEAMLAANVCAADFIGQAEHAGLFRVHEGPTPEKRQTLQNYLKLMGLGFTLSDEPKPAELQAIAKATQGRPDAQQIHTMLLRSMQQAVYTPHNSGHFGLAYSAYTHFTSPIRRYPDLLVHRVIKALLQGKHYSLRGVGAGVARQTMRPKVLKPGALPAAPAPAAKPVRGAAGEIAQWEEVGQHCSANERRADEASRDVEAWLKCRYMRERLGEEFSGTITSVAGFGVFVTLDALYVEGLVHITELGGEYFRFDEVRQELRGERTGLRYAIGTKVRVQVSRVDLDGRRIDFRMVREGEAERLLAKGRPGAKAALKTPVTAGGALAAEVAHEEPASALDALAELAAADRATKQAAKAARQARPAAGAKKAAAKRTRATGAGLGHMAAKSATKGSKPKKAR